MMCVRVLAYKRVRGARNVARKEEKVLLCPHVPQGEGAPSCIQKERRCSILINYWWHDPPPLPPLLPSSLALSWFTPA